MTDLFRVFYSSNYSSSLKLSFSNLQQDDWRKYECVVESQHNQSAVVSQLNIHVLRKFSRIVTVCVLSLLHDFFQRLIGVNLDIMINCSIGTIIDVTGQRHRSLSSRRNPTEQSTSTLACRIPSNVKLLVDHSRSLSGERTALS